MKKVLAIFIALTYFAISSGLVLTVHYCMGEEAGSSIRFTEKEAHTCDKCGMTVGKNKCCNNEVKFIKVQDQHQQSTADFQVTAPAVPEPEYNLPRPGFHMILDAAPVPNHSPPDTGQPSRCVLHCIFRI